MKYLVILFLVLAGCTSKTKYGDCIGLDAERDPTKIYKPSARNIVLGVIFIELIVPPIYVLLDEFECPVGDKDDI